MKLEQMEVVVTHHALTRWLERASAYADDDKADLLAVFRSECVEAQPGELPGITLKPGSRYFRHTSGSVFVTEAASSEKLRIVTVIMPDELLPRPAVKKKPPPRSKDSRYPVQPASKPPEPPPPPPGTLKPRWQDSAADAELEALDRKHLQQLLAETRGDYLHVQRQMGECGKKSVRRADLGEALRIKGETLRKLKSVSARRNSAEFNERINASVRPAARALLRELSCYDFAADPRVVDLIARLEAVVFPAGPFLGTLGADVGEANSGADGGA